MQISIHALREEGDLPASALPLTAARFLSTPSARRATRELKRCTYEHLFLSTPSARRATLFIVAHECRKKDFYPRPPRGGRLDGKSKKQKIDQFLSTPSARRATEVRPLGRKRFGISIHALREEGDPSFPSWIFTQRNFYPRPPRGGRRRQTVRESKTGNFYPRPPRGGRPLADEQIAAINEFLSTPSARRATCWRSAAVPPLMISIHALREEGDDKEIADAFIQAEFLSTPSARRAT